MHTYTFKRKRGIDDLKGQRPEQGTEWWSERRWKEWNFMQPIWQAWNARYVDYLKRVRKYGEEYTETWSVKHNPVFDEPLATKPSLTSVRFILIDLTENEKGTS